MKFILPITTLIASVLLATNVEAKTHFSPEQSWDYLIGAESDSLITSSKKDVVTIDLEKAEQYVPYLHSKGQKVICYFSGGTMQDSREIDYNDYLKANIQLSKISGWGNHFIDIRNKAKLQPLIKRRMERARSYNCDGVEVDSIDLYNHGVPGYTKDDTITFGKWVAETAKSVGISVGLKNSAGCVSALEPYFDFAVVESCAEDANVCNLFTKFTDHDKAVFVVHYYEDGYKLSSESKVATLVKEAGNRRFSCIVTDEKVHGSSQSYDCSKGTAINPSEKPKVTTTTTTTTTVTASATPNSTNPSTKTTPDANSAPGLSNIVPGNNTATAAPKEVGNAVGNTPNGNDKKEGGSNVGLVVSLFAAGGVATAAVAGFVFLKKHKKFTSDDEEFSLD